MSTTDDFIRQLEELRPQIDRAIRRGERVRVKLYASDSVGPPELRVLYGAKLDRPSPAVAFSS